MSLFSSQLRIYHRLESASPFSLFLQGELIAGISRRGLRIFPGMARVHAQRFLGELDEKITSDDDSTSGALRRDCYRRGSAVESSSGCGAHPVRELDRSMG